MGTPSQETGVNSLARTAEDGANPMLGWLLEAWRKQKFTLSELEMPELLWQMLKITVEGQRTGHAGMDVLRKARKCTCSLCSVRRPRGPSICQNDKECTGRGDAAWLKSSMVPVFHKPRLTVGDAVTGLGPLIARGMMES